MKWKDFLQNSVNPVLLTGEDWTVISGFVVWFLVCCWCPRCRNRIQSWGLTTFSLQFPHESLGRSRIAHLHQEVDLFLDFWIDWSCVWYILFQLFLCCVVRHFTFGFCARFCRAVPAAVALASPSVLLLSYWKNRCTEVKRICANWPPFCSKWWKANYRVPSKPAMWHFLCVATLTFLSTS